MQRANPRLQGLYVITDERLGGGHLAIARAAIAGGASILQLRDKSTPPRQLLPVARELRRLTRAAGVLFIVNDRPDLALAFEADGVHLGPDDLPPAQARRVLGNERIIGVSCGDEEEARRAAAEDADYIGAGAIFGSATKHDAGPAIGLERLRAIVAATPLPVAAIGGLNAANIAAVKAAGAAMACVISAVTSAAGEVGGEDAGEASGETAMARATRDLAERFS